MRKFVVEKLDGKTANVNEVTATANVNLCEELVEGEEMVINYTYTDLGRQLMILDIGAPVSLAGKSWTEQYLKDSGLKVEDMKRIICDQFIGISVTFA